MNETYTNRSATNRVVRGYSITIDSKNGKEELWIDGVKHRHSYTEQGYALYHSGFHKTLLEAALEYISYLPEKKSSAPIQGE